MFHIQRREPQLLSLFLLVLFGFSISPQAEGKTFKVYYLGGQSNMEGFGRVMELPSDLRADVSGVMIFHGNSSPDGSPVDGRGIWSTLRPGHGVGFQSDGQSNTYSDRFGIEITFAKRMLEANSEHPIALIKYARGGTSIDESAAQKFGCWEPDYRGGDGLGLGVNQYDHFLATIRQAMLSRDIDGDGEIDQLIPAGIVWMQGESDAAHTPETAEKYEANLKRLIDLIRAALRADDLPVVIGRISDSKKAASGKVWRFGEVVREKQASFVRRDASAALVTSTDEYGYSDPWHYDSKGYIDLGEKFAEALSTLIHPK